MGRILARKMAHFSTFRAVNDHFWSIGDHRCKSSFLVPDQCLGVQNNQLGRADKTGEKKIQNFFSKGSILARKSAHFSTFRTVNDHFWSLGDHCWKTPFLVPDQSSGVQNDQLGRAEKMGKKKIQNFFFKGPHHF